MPRLERRICPVTGVNKKKTNMNKGRIKIKKRGRKESPGMLTTTLDIWWMEFVQQYTAIRRSNIIQSAAASGNGLASPRNQIQVYCRTCSTHRLDKRVMKCRHNVTIVARSFCYCFYISIHNC
jgi:hypothetical protein